MSVSGKKEDNKKRPLMAQSFQNALRGISYAVKTERNLKTHIIIAVMVVVASLFFNLTRIEIIALFIVISMVLIAELINTAAEHITDMITEEHHPLAKIIKDIMAGAVLLSSLCAAFVGYLIFMRPETRDLGEAIVLRKIAYFPPYAAAVAVIVVFGVSVLLKLRAGEKFSLAGGMPSIHTAVAFSITVISYSVSSSLNILFLSLLLALMVAQARISAKIHTIWEVFAGAVVGSSLTILILQLVL